HQMGAALTIYMPAGTMTWASTTSPIAPLEQTDDVRPCQASRGCLADQGNPKDQMGSPRRMAPALERGSNNDGASRHIKLRRTLDRMDALGSDPVLGEGREIRLLDVKCARRRRCDQAGIPGAVE